MTLPDEVLMAYADGNLDAKARAEVEQAIANDPQIARRVAAHKELQTRIKATFDPVIGEPVPERLLAAARATSRPRESAVVVPLRPKAARQPRLPYWGAIAASFVMGAVVWHFAGYTAGPVSEKDGQLVASGALSTALSNQLVKDQSAQSPVQIGVSFRSKDGSYCRTFQTREQLAGLACREQNAWKLQMVARGEAAGTTQPEYRPAGSALPASIVRAVDQSIDGDPLDADAEARARADQWRASK